MLLELLLPLVGSVRIIYNRAGDYRLLRFALPALWRLQPVMDGSCF